MEASKEVIEFLRYLETKDFYFMLRGYEGFAGFKTDELLLYLKDTQRGLAAAHGVPFPIYKAFEHRSFQCSGITKSGKLCGNSARDVRWCNHPKEYVLGDTDRCPIHKASEEEKKRLLEELLKTDLPDTEVKPVGEV